MTQYTITIEGYESDNTPEEIAIRYLEEYELAGQQQVEITVEEE